MNSTPGDRNRRRAHAAPAPVGPLAGAYVVALVLIGVVTTLVAILPPVPHDRPGSHRAGSERCGR
jgi:hypothetical protein